MKIKEKIQLFFTGNQRSVTVKKNIIASLGLKGISILVSFLLVPLTIGYVSSELYGVWLTLSSILTWINFLDLGFSQGLKNKLTEAIANNDWQRGKSLVSTTYFLMFLIFVPVSIILNFIIPDINWSNLLNVSAEYNEEIIRVMCVIIVFACLQMIFNVIVSVVAAFQKVALSNSFSVIGNILALIVIFILTKTCPPSLMALSITMSGMPLLVTIVSSIFLYNKPFRSVSPSVKFIKKKYVKDLFSLGYKFFIINVQVIVLYQSTNILISNISSPNEVTSYNIAYRLMNTCMMLFNIATGPLWPAYTDAYARDDFEWMKNARSKMTRLLLLCIGGCVLLTILSKPIYYIWIGGKAKVPFLMTLLVAAYVSVYCWMNLNGTLLVGMSKITLETILVIWGMIMHIPLSLFLGNYLGAYGVLVSLIFINLVYAVLMNLQVGKIISKKAYGIWAR